MAGITSRTNHILFISILYGVNYLKLHHNITYLMISFNTKKKHHNIPISRKGTITLYLAQ